MVTVWFVTNREIRRKVVVSLLPAKRVVRPSGIEKEEHLELCTISLALQIRHTSSELLHKAFISEVHVLWLRSNMEVTQHFKNGNKIYGIGSDLLP